MPVEGEPGDLKPAESAPYINTSTCRVYLKYDVDKPLPAPPGPAWTRFVCISDTHSNTFPVPTGDVLLHSGDLTNRGRLAEFEKTFDWISALPHRIKMFVQSNASGSMMFIVSIALLQETTTYHYIATGSMRTTRVLATAKAISRYYYCTNSLIGIQ